jgi:Outer membrane receptor proteins, mostly Fe transport
MPAGDDIDTGITLIGENFDFERVPEVSASLGVSKEIQMETLGFSNMGSLTLRADWSYRSETFNDAYNTAVLETDAYDLIDASIRWSNRNEDWIVTLTGRNLSDEEYLVTGVYGTAFQVFEGTYDRGRQWQLEVRKYFRGIL